MNKPILVLGAGGHAKVLIDALKLRCIEILGLIEQEAPTTSPYVLGLPIIGDHNKVFQYKPESILLVNGLGTTGNTDRRKILFLQFKNRGYKFSQVIHPSAVIGSEVELCEGAQIMAGAVIQAGARVGVNSIINTHASIDHDCVIGDHVHIAPGVALSGGVHIGNGCHIGTGATIIQNIHVGDNSLIGAGALVNHNIPANAKAIGVPARVR